MTNLELKNRVSELTKKNNFTSDNMDDLEMQDVVDSQDVVIGSLPRGVIWDNGLENNTRVVNIFVVNKVGKVLLPVRSMNKRYLPGGYDYSCGENVMSGEKYPEAATRGLKEELGLTGLILREVGVFSPNPEKGLFCFGRVYIVHIDDKGEIIANKEEVAEVRWESIETIRKMLIGEEKEKFKRDYEAIFYMAFEGRFDDK